MIKNKEIRKNELTKKRIIIYLKWNKESSKKYKQKEKDESGKISYKKITLFLEN